MGAFSSPVLDETVLFWQLPYICIGAGWAEKTMTFHMFLINVCKLLFRTTHVPVMIYLQASEMGFQMVNEQEDKYR